MSIFLLYIIIGTLIGLLSGLLGIGGGLIAVPGLNWALSSQGLPEGIVMHMAIATSLSTIIFTASASIRAFNREGDIVWKLVKSFLPGICIGTLSGIIVSHYLLGRDLRIIFGVFVFFVAIRLFFEKSETNSSAKSTTHTIHYPHFIAIVTGFCAGLLGVGGSIIIIPYLLFHRFTMRQASGISIACALPIAIIAVISVILSSWHVPKLPAYSTGYIYWPATFGIALPSIFTVPLGAKLARHLPQSKLRKIFAVFLIFVTFDMLFMR